MKEFVDLAKEPGEKGREDTQGCWQGILAGYLNNCTLLDVGAGLGESKERMSIRGITVTTQDPGPGTPVDLHDDISAIPDKSYDYVSAFDVIEHLEEPGVFLRHMQRIARHGVFLTTPNVAHTGGTHIYHFREYYPREMYEMMASTGMIFVAGWMMFPDGPPNIRRTGTHSFIENRFCFNYGLLFRP